MGYQIPETIDGKSVHAEAFDLAVAQLQERQTVVDDDVKVALVSAIMDLVEAGQKDAQALARYAVSKVRVG